MRPTISKLFAVGVLAMAFACSAQPAPACTGVKLTAKDGSIVYGRTMEFGLDLESNPIVIPRGFPLAGAGLHGKPGLAWESKYAAVGMDAEGMVGIVDGTNEKGLAAGIFYLPNYAQYEVVAPGEESRTLGPWELVTWILTNFASVAEVRSGLAEIHIGEVPAPVLDFVPPVHYVVHDSQGGSIVIEYLKGKLNVVDNPVGVITNSPEFSWHLTNLSNYVMLEALNPPPLKEGELEVRPFGQGTGMVGLPGDFTSPSRFVRAVALSQASLKGETGEQAVEGLFHVLDSFDIPRGAVEDISGGGKIYESTEWTSASDLTNHVFYFHTRDNRRVRRIELMKADLDAVHISRFPSAPNEQYEDLRAVGQPRQ